jgi:molybdate transport system ATP-binding protein
VTAAGLDARIVASLSDAFRLDASLSIPPGTTAALLGPNGSGKSTMVAALAGLLPIDSGSIALDGEVFDDPGAGIFVPPEMRRVGVVFQDLLLFEHLDVIENVAFGLRSSGIGRSEAADRSRLWLERLGVGAMARRKPGDLSGGQAQRVALARALATEPALLLLDEPLSALDVAARADLRRTLGGHLAGFAGPRLLITHDPTEAFLLADEIHVIEDGEITQSGTADEIRLQPRTRYAADLAGLNFVKGVARGGEVDAGTHTLRVADRDLEGPVLVTVHPAAIAVYVERPGGSPRNVWQTTVERVEQVGSRVRLLTGPPLRLAVEVTDTARTELRLEVGARIWVALKATEIRVQPEVIAAV